MGPTSLSLDHGASSVQWSHRESHPDLQRAMLASSGWTMTPKRKTTKPTMLRTVPVGARTRTHKRHACRRLPSKQVPHHSDSFHNRSHQGGSRPTPTMLRTVPGRCPDSNSQTAIRRHLFSRQAPHPAGWLPLSIKLRRLESNQHEDLQSVSSYR